MNWSREVGLVTGERRVTFRVAALLLPWWLAVAGIATAQGDGATGKSGQGAAASALGRVSALELLRGEGGLEGITPVAVTPTTADRDCLECHGAKNFGTPKGKGTAFGRRELTVDVKKLARSAHAERRCVECHTDVREIPHPQGVKLKVDCAGECHAKLSHLPALTETLTPEAVSQLMVVVGSYMGSVHARPKVANPQEPNAGCADCHKGHAIFPLGSREWEEARQELPGVCGKCHPKELQAYEGSVHGVKAIRYGDPKAAVCSDCHTAHKVLPAKEDPARLVITKNCGHCHEEEYQSFANTYHGQVNALGYTHTAKCFDCHEAHDTRWVTDPASRVSGLNRSATCQKCHKGVSAGFLQFLPHGNTHDFERYPEMWLASKSMILLLVGVFLFFWSHSALWFLREFKERRALGVRVRSEALAAPSGEGESPGVVRLVASGRSSVLRFRGRWRVLHLTFALSIMLLSLTGMTVLYPESFWAPTVVRVFGGAEVLAVLHRLGAVLFAGAFFGHLVLVFLNVSRRLKRGEFQWFGPCSLLPRWQDLSDFLAMMRWFFGKGPRPRLDHWTYWEKFDYWAPFWGMFIIGASGVSLWFPAIVGQYLPGWIFNVATIVHGEEAFLAAVFLFSVHFFNCHLRPSKFPLDIMMFVGSMPLEEFRHERPEAYRRLVERGELEKYLVNPPTRGWKLFSTVLGFALVGIGLTLLVMILSGFVQDLLG
ncbi:MAG: cytochrome C [Magnetococcales bacterium]|nr:cytochrome C [Magnetococcales bacterium]MBF0156407.1 cytochrome C [Magnetococcales bacterium]